MSLVKINPALWITNTSPSQEGAISVSQWYEDERATITDPEKIQWLISQGWRIDSQETETDSNSVKTHTYKMSRRVLNPEKAVQKLINSYTSAYNEGRSLNDIRYDDIVTLYCLMLDKTENEINSINSDDDTYEDLIDQILSGLESDYATYKTAIDGIFDGYGASELLRINTAFNARLASAKIELVNRGMYNSTIWTDTSAGVERERQVAITDLNDKIAEMQMGKNDRLFKARIDVRLAVLNARDRLRNMLNGVEEQHTLIRNRVMNALLDFMERREDSYPDLNGMTNVASNLGAGSASFPG